MKIFTQRSGRVCCNYNYLSFAFFLMLCSTSFTQAQNITFRSHLSYPSEGTSNIWGYVDGAGTEYALVGIYEGLSIVNVSNPDAPEELFIVPTLASQWHEIKIWNQHAYVTNETGGGVLIVDLSNLPDTVTYSYFTDPGGANIQTVHSLWIDEHGYLYLFGSNYGQVNHGGADIYNLNNDPDLPEYISSYTPTGDFNTDYIHDGFVRGDTLWAAHVYIGVLEVVDVSDKENLLTLTSFTTPNFFTHNCEPTSDNHYLFTTDEVNNSYLASYDVSDLDNVTLLDKAQSNPGSNAIVHNVHLYTDSFAVTSYYTEGAVIWDITHPDNMIKVGQYDETPLTGGGYGGDWGVYPYLPSGTLLLSDIELGLYVLTPQYIHAGWLYGVVTNENNGGLLNNVEVEIGGTENTAFTDLSGTYKTGAGGSGSFDITFSKPGYYTKVISGFALESGIYDTLNVALAPLPSFAYAGQVIDAASPNQEPVPFAQVQMENNIFSFLDTTDATGHFNFPIFYEGNYDILVGQWGYLPAFYGAYPINNTTGQLTVPLNAGYYDDFALNFGWKENGDALYGKWIQAEPLGTNYYGNQANPEVDVSNDYGNECFVTGNNGTEFYEDPVFLGATELSSPSFDISLYNDPYLKYYVWFMNVSAGTTNKLLVYLVSGSDSVLIETLKSSNTVNSIWKQHKIRVKNFLTPTSAMSLHFYADNPIGSYNLFECGVDKFEIVDSVTIGIDDVSKLNSLLQPFPNPFNELLTLQYEWIGQDVSDAELVLLNLQGVAIVSKKITVNSGNVTFSEGDLAAGIYFAQLRNKNGVIKTVKVIKE